MGGSCWICEAAANVTGTQRDSDYVDCARCGPYVITRTLSASKLPLPRAERHRLSYWCRQRKLDGREPPSLDSNSIKAIIAQLPDPRPNAKADLLLVSLSKAFPRPGQPLTFDPSSDYPLACAIDPSEASFHFRTLKDRGSIVGEGIANITAGGWDRIEHLAASPHASKTAFIAMHFSSDMLAMWQQSFGEAVTRAGFDPVLANIPEHNEQIDARIVAGILQARFVVADVTGARTGVYFEAGYALGLGRPVIWTCKADRKDDMHFDTRQYNHILWNGADDLREQLYYRIVATI